MYLHHTPILIQKILPGFTWRKDPTKQYIYLTFDDGPIPEITNWVLEILLKYNIKATFFCVGDNIKKNSSIFHSIISQGHAVGNHTFNHIKGLETSDETYIANTEICTSEILKNNYNTKLFRPPHGKLKFSQAKRLRNLGYEIVMWDVLSGDFDSKLSSENCLANTIKATRNGSIIVFHDSIKTFEKLQFVLPNYIESMLKKGFIFKSL